MPVTIIEVGKAPICEYLLAVAVFLIALVMIMIYIEYIKKRGILFNIEAFPLAVIFLLCTSGFYIICRDICGSPDQDVNIAYVNTSYARQFLLEGSFPKAEDLRDGTTVDEDRLLYSGHDLEKIIKGNKYYIFKLDGFKTDVESVEEIVEKYNKKYDKNIKTEDLVIVRSDRY